jgi:hypothetical protein
VTARSKFNCKFQLLIYGQHFAFTIGKFVEQLNKLYCRFLKKSRWIISISGSFSDLGRFVTYRTFHDGTFHNGSFRDLGPFVTGSFRDGTLCEGPFCDGSFCDGTFCM